MTTVDKTRVNRWVSLCLLVVLGIFGLVLLLHLAAKVFGPSKSACTKQVCLSKFLQGPPAFNDPALASYLRANYFTPPAGGDYKLSGVDGYTTEYHDKLLEYVKDFFKNKRGGVFVDLGAGDGEYRSLTLPLERDLGWTGLLVEPNPDLYTKLLQKGRKADSTKACVAPFSYPSKMHLSYPGSGGQTEEEKVKALGRGKLNQLWLEEESNLVRFEAQCIPLENLIYTAGITTAFDLLVLDMSGSDLDVLLNTKMDSMPDIEMIVMHTHGENIGDDIGGYFLERNMVVKKVFGFSKESAAYVLVKFDARRDL